jgi:hypothetical protein
LILIVKNTDTKGTFCLSNIANGIERRSQYLINISNVPGIRLFPFADKISVGKDCFDVEKNG